MPYNNDDQHPFRFLSISESVSGVVPGVYDTKLKCFESVEAPEGISEVPVGSRILYLDTFSISTDRYQNGFYNMDTPRFDKITFVIRTSHILENAIIHINTLTDFGEIVQVDDFYKPLSPTSLITVCTIDCYNDNIGRADTQIIDFTLELPEYPSGFYFQLTEAYIFRNAWFAIG